MEQKTSETKFTPGPWYVEHGVPEEPRIFSSVKNILTSIVCECIGARSRRKHDAALIAAAPDMYELLEAMEREGNQEFPLNRIGDVLKKARGEK